MAFDVQLAGGFYLGDISDAIGGLSFDFGVGKVAQFSFEAVDADQELTRHGLTTPGRELRIDDSRWDVAAVERDYRGRDVWLTVEARSAVARRLRLMVGGSKETNVTPGQWIGKRVRRAGGVAVVEPGAKRRTINQKRSESALDVIASLASDTSVEWVEYGGRVWVGTAWWAYQGKTGLPTFPVSMRGNPRSGELSGLSLSTRESIDDREQAAEASLTVEPALGQLVRPWNRVELTDVPEPDRGLWLVTNVSFTQAAGDVSLSLQRPLKSSPKNGSNGEDNASTGAGVGGEPVAGSSYSDVPVPANWPGRSVSQIETIFRNNPGGLGKQIFNGCLWYAQEIAGYPHIGANPEVLWDAVASSKRRASRDIVPGAVVLYSNSNIGHAVVYMGGGRCLSTDMDSTGRYVPGKWAIAPIDVMEKSFGLQLLGWYVP